MVHGQEKLGDIQGKHIGVEASVSVASDDVHKDDADVHCGVFADSSKLSWVKKIMGDAIELKVLGEDFGEQLAQGVEKRDGVEGFW